MRSTIRLVKTSLGHEAIVADWRYQKSSKHYKVKKEYSGITECIKDATDDFTDEGYMSDGEWLDVIMDLYDTGIAIL